MLHVDPLFSAHNKACSNSYDGWLINVSASFTYLVGEQVYIMPQILIYPPPPQLYVCEQRCSALFANIGLGRNVRECMVPKSHLPFRIPFNSSDLKAFVANSEDLDQTARGSTLFACSMPKFVFGVSICMQLTTLEDYFFKRIFLVTG